ncbi:ABC transporter ATP-binding protein [Gordonia sp. NPDC003376]
MITTEQLTVRLGGVTVLDDVSMTVAPGDLVYLVGRNGAGKSTLLRACCGAQPTTSGRVLIGGRPTRSLPTPMTALGVHLGGDVTAPGGHTGRRYLRWLAAAGGVDSARVDKVLDQVGLADVGSRRVGAYSLGMRQRLGIGAALLGRAPALLLDEPLNGLDIDGIRWFRGLIADLTARGCAVLIASHMFDEVARTGDRVVVLDHGRVAADAAVGDFIGSHPDLESAYVALTTPGTAMAR